MFNDIREFNGRKYTGVPVGSGHLWDYTNAIWEETKVTDDKWHIKFSSLKRRSKPAPVGSGCALGTGYHWLIIADQCVKKVSTDEYQTFMEGVKFKIGHRRPYWKNWSYTYPEQPTYRQKLISALKSELARLEAEEAAGTPVTIPAIAQLVMKKVAAGGEKC